MGSNFEKAFKLFEDGVSELGKGIEQFFDGLTTEKEEGSKIRIKKGSKVYIGKGVVVKLTQDVEAELIDDTEVPSGENKN